MHKSLRIWPAILLFFISGTLTASTKLLRFPDIHGDTVVFSYAGDLWRASTSGGTAVRLTSHTGLELFPRFSPDGRWIAFTGQYDGDEQVFIMPTEGGPPKQLTFYPARGPLPPRWGYDHQVYGWSPDGSAVLFRSMRDSWDISDTNLYLVPVDGGMPQRLPMPKSGAGDLSPDGKRIVYSPLARDFRSWKRYEGGWASELYIFNLDGSSAEQITEHVRSDRDPMWIGNAIYFNADRTNKFNLYRYDLQSKQTTQVTRFTDFDVRWPSADSRSIVFEHNGELQVLDTANGNVRKLAITVPDDGVAKRPEFINVANRIENFGISPKAKRALFAARGDIFTVPVEHGVTRNLTQTSDAHDRSPAWSPNGKHIVYISDKSGEQELWVIDHDGGEPKQLTEGSGGRLYQPSWSPDNEHIAYEDQMGKLRVINVNTKAEIQVADEPSGRVGDYTWSPHGGFLAFTLTSAAGFNSIHIWSKEDGQTRKVTSDYFNEYSPAWDPKGNYIYFIGARSYAPQIGQMEWNYSLDRNRGLYALALRKDVPHLFPPRNDEVEVEKEKPKEDKADKDKKEDKDKKKKKGKKDADKKDEPEKPKFIKIEFEGLGDRVIRVPVDFDVYVGLSATETHLHYARIGAFFYGRGSDVTPELHAFSFKDREGKKIADAINGYALSDDNKKLLVSSRGTYKLMDAGKGGKGKNVSTRNLSTYRIPEQEWEAIFDEVWRRFRDFFYVPNMHGYDWAALRDQYKPLLEHVAHRDDLNYVISEMIAELSVSHAYISGGDADRPRRPRAALIGARFNWDTDSGLYRFAHIYGGQNDEPKYRSPLTEVGMDVSVNDYLFAINGTNLSADTNPFEVLRYLGGKTVELLVGKTAEREKAKRVLVEPIGSETSVQYLEWITENRRKVAEATDGRVGYLHIPDMGANGIYEFIKWYYGQIRKEGLVIDVRGNGGGNVSQMLIGRLNRQILNLGFSRTNDRPTTYPNVVYQGHMVCLLNQTSASDGDIFPYTFKKAGLGPLIGKRSWGGVVGITGHGPLLDGGGVNVPEFGFADADGTWSVEGYGVDPDIEVENNPVDVLNGKDAQLERGIQEVMRKIRTEPRSLPARPAAPVKTGQ